MARSTPLIRKTALLVAVVGAAGGAFAGSASAAEPAGKKPATNTFSLVVTATPRPPGAAGAAQGVGIAPKPVVNNPYQVPLIQNAGTLGAR
jgi:hypothetical protein